VEVALNAPQEGGDFFGGPIQGKGSFFPRVTPHISQGAFLQLPLPQLQPQGNASLKMVEEAVRRPKMKLSVYQNPPGAEHTVEPGFHFPGPGKQDFVHPPLIVG